MRALPCVLMLAVLATQTGCSTVSGWFSGKDNAPQPVPAPTVQNSLHLQLERYRVDGAGQHSVFSPAIVDGRVYATGEDGDIVSLEPKIAKLKFGEDISAGLSAQITGFAAGTEKGQVLAIDAQGKALWTAQLQTEILSTPVLVGDKVLVRTQDGAITALDQKSGQIIWDYRVEAGSLSLRQPYALTVDDGVVYAGFSGARLKALFLQNGELQWEARLSRSMGANELERLNDVVAAPVVDANQVCAVAYQGRLACYAKNTGALLWSREASSYQALDMDATQVYLTDDMGIVQAFNKETGATNWKQDKLFARQVSAPLILDSTLYVGDYQGYVYALDSQTGALVARVETDGSPIKTPAQAFNQQVVVQTQKGSVYLMSKR